jgi:DNA replication protein DnaC
VTGDARCMVCRGTGEVDAWGRTERCACVDVPRRDPYAPPSAGWVGETMGVVLASVAKRQAEAEEHARTCTDRPCDRCQRYVCSCGKPVDGWRRTFERPACDDCRRAKRTAQALEPVRGSVPKRFRWTFDATVEKLRGRVRASDEFIARGLANPPSSDAVFFGDTAAGKTSLAVAMLDAWVRRDPDERKGARFVESYWLAGARARHPLGQGEAPAVIEAMEAGLLVVDDLGSEADDRRNVLADVIFHRHNEELPTWITTGFTAEQLVARYGSQVLRRVLENGKRVTLGAKP